jgi:hypothetical protein
MVFCVNMAFYHNVPGVKNICGTLIVTGAVVMLPLVDIMSCQMSCRKKAKDDDDSGRAANNDSGNNNDSRETPV